ncbi:MAG: Gfo/Idh/MocA family oxidoreductase [Verrucomicrobiota bacterium]
MKTNTGFTRRVFVQRAAGAAIAAAVFPKIIPSSALGAEGQVAPSNRTTVGCIGLGPQGTGVMRGFLGQKDAQVVALCDLKQEQLEQATGLVNTAYQNQDCKTYGDFRELLQRKDIDACLVATPDHWHVLIAMAAAKAGKDVYMEKPMSCSLAESQALREAMQKYKRVFQFGTQQRSDRKFRLACELVRNQLIGELKHINVWAPGSSAGGSKLEVPVPPTLNYDFWLGPAPFKPYTEDRCAAAGDRKTWWFISDYTYGFITGWGIHPMDIAMWGGDTRLDGPVEIAGQAHYSTEGVSDTATTWDINYKFASGVTLNFAGTPNPQIRGTQITEPWPHEAELKQRFGALQKHGTTFEGTNGWVLVDRAKIVTYPEHLATEKPDTFKVRLKESVNHVRDFLDSIKSRKPTVAPVEEAFRSDAMCQLGDIASRLKRPLTFDPKQEKFIKDSEANSRLKARTMRKPWKL